MASALSRSDDELLLAVPEAKAGAPMLTALAALPAFQERRQELLTLAMQRDEKYAKPRYLRSEDLLAQLDEPAELCFGEQRPVCLEEAERLASRLKALEPDSERMVIIRARLLHAQGKGEQATRLLTDSCPVFTQRLDCLRWRVRLAERSHDAVELDAASSTYLSAACSSSTACAAAASWLGGVFMSSRQVAKALEMFERAAREQGTPQAWQQVAVAAQRMGLEGAAQRARQHAARAGGQAGERVTEELEKKELEELLRP
jgi:hypothetical protein